MSDNLARTSSSPAPSDRVVHPVGLRGPIPLAALFGSGRSGSSWLGALVNSHPEVAFRYEPFHRLKDVPRIAEARRVLESQALDDTALETVYGGLLPSTCLAEPPPFFPKTNALRLGRSWVWHAAKAVAPVENVYRTFYTPRGRPPLVFKEVTLEPMMANILQRSTMRCLYLVRHPGAVVASQLRGQASKVMPPPDGAVRGMLERLGGSAQQRFLPKLAELSDCQKHALLWRSQVELGLTAVKDNPRAMLLLYENLVTDTLGCVERVFRHFGLEPAEQTREFISVSTSGSQKARWLSGEGLVEDYFSVFKDAKESMEKWMTQLDATQKSQIATVLEDSPAFAHCNSFGHWPAL